MNSSYIVDYEIWQGANNVGWGNMNFYVEHGDRIDAGEIPAYVEREALDRCGIPNVKIRIRGIFKL